MQNLYETDNESINSMDSTKILHVKEKYNPYSDSLVKRMVSKCEKLSDNDDNDTKNFKEKESLYNCKLCFNKSPKENYMILSCNHIFHIECLAESHFADVYKYPIIDNEYFSNRKCTTCSQIMQLEEVMYLHGKFLSNTKNLIQKHQSSIEHLEHQMKQIKNELRTCYDYKHKLEQEREKSKQIVSILTTMM